MNSNYNLHQKLLYRWVGREIEGSNQARPNGTLKRLKLRPLTSEQREQYMKRIRSALNPNEGLFMRPFEETLGGGEVRWIPTLPCLSFTEIELGHARAHCELYGRLGFGIAKQTILNRGGRPVAYIQGGASDSVFKQLRGTLEALRRGKARASVIEGLEHQMHFFKRLRAMVAAREKTGQSKGKSTRTKPAPVDPTAAMSFKKLKAFDFLDEQEWRIAGRNPEKNFRAAKHSKAGFWFPIQPGTELRVMVVPDNATMHAVFNERKLRSVVSCPGRPPVQIISFETVGFM